MMTNVKNMLGIDDKERYLFKKKFIDEFFPQKPHGRKLGIFFTNRIEIVSSFTNLDKVFPLNFVIRGRP
jgi:hypothetical protein